MTLTEETARVALATMELVQGLLEPGSSCNLTAAAVRVVIDFREQVIVVYSPDGTGVMSAHRALRIDPHDPDFGVPALPVSEAMLVTDGKCH